MNGPLRRLAAAAIVLPSIVLAGCASMGAVPASSPRQTAPPAAMASPPTVEPTPPLSPQDADALAQLADVAPRTSTIDPDLADWTECWRPSEHLVAPGEVGNDTTWKVICRIHWHQEDGTARYQDTTCIGDFAQQPMLDHCYRWVHYDYEPEFGDAPAVLAGAISDMRSEH